MPQQRSTSRKCYAALARLGLFSLITVAITAAGKAQTATDDPNQPLHKLGISGQDHRVRMENEGWPWTSLGRINRYIGGHCTGALIAPHWVLTAAHCIYNSSDGRWAIPSDIHFVTGYNRGQFLGHAIGKRIIRSPGYQGAAENQIAQMAHDWALIELDHDLAQKPIPIAREDVSLAQGPVTVTVAGYSGDFQQVLTAHIDCHIIGINIPKLLLHDCDATYGASGAPLLRITPEGAEIVGIQSGVGQYNKKDIGIATPISSFLPALSAVQ